MKFGEMPPVAEGKEDPVGRQSRPINEYLPEFAPDAPEKKDPEKELEKVPAEFREEVRPYLTDESEVEEFIPAESQNGGGEIRIAYNKNSNAGSFKRLTIKFERNSPDGAWEKKESIETVNAFKESWKKKNAEVWDKSGLSKEEQDSLKGAFSKAGITEGVTINNIEKQSDVKVVVRTTEAVPGGLIDHNTGYVPNLKPWNKEYTFIKVGDSWESVGSQIDLDKPNILY